jgi:hypothetical protein
VIGKPTNQERVVGLGVFTSERGKGGVVETVPFCGLLRAERIERARSVGARLKTPSDLLEFLQTRASNLAFSLPR